MSVIQTAQQSLQHSNRRILVTGPRASGKTTFSVSASRFAGEKIRAIGDRSAPIQCKDVLLIQGDNEGLMGAVDAGLIPGYVLDMTHTKDWQAFGKRLVEGLTELRGKLTDGTIRILIIDLALPAKLIDRAIDPSVQRDWKLVANEGAKLFTALSGLNGVTVIGNAQIKAAVAPGETTIGADAATAKAIGGERSTFTIDLPKGIASHWLDNSSFVFTREAKRVKGPGGTTTRAFKTLTQSSSRFEAKSRAESLLLPTEPGDRTLHSLLQTAYGENY